MAQCVVPRSAASRTCSPEFWSLQKSISVAFIRSMRARFRTGTQPTWSLQQESWEGGRRIERKRWRGMESRDFPSLFSSPRAFDSGTTCSRPSWQLALTDEAPRRPIKREISKIVRIERNLRMRKVAFAAEESLLLSKARVCYMTLNDVTEANRNLPNGAAITTWGEREREREVVRERGEERERKIMQDRENSVTSFARCRYAQRWMVIRDWGKVDWNSLARRDTNVTKCIALSRDPPFLSFPLGISSGLLIAGDDAAPQRVVVGGEVLHKRRRFRYTLQPFCEMHT